MIRFLDILFSLTILAVGFPIFLVFCLIGLVDTGSPIFIQERVGRNQKPFNLIKFRTMHKDTPSLASHMVDPNSVTKFGNFLRKTKLDELLQFWNVLLGEMSIVGPRPCLFSQKELITERVARNVYDVLPGITGLAQIKKIDMSTPKLLAEIDAAMISKMTVANYFRYIFLTFIGKGQGDSVSH